MMMTRSQRSKTVIPLQRQETHLPVPSYATPGAAGVDLRAAIDDPVIIPPNSSRLISSGIIILLPPSIKAEVRGRSGLALNHNVVAFNGLIDPDYRGTISVLLFNHSATKPYVVMPGERIAQLVFEPFLRVQFEEVEEIDAQGSSRGISGFGSTGSN